MDSTKIYRIQDLSDEHTIGILRRGLDLPGEPNALRRNYSAEFSYDPANLFHQLAQGKYQNGCYYVVADHEDRYIGSAGWYHHDRHTALIMTRMYVSQEHRTSYILGNMVLPRILNEVRRYRRVWMTMNQYNKSLYTWFLRKEQRGNSGIANWPAAYNNFKPIGMKVVNGVDQFVVELIKGEGMTKDEKLALLIEGVAEITAQDRGAISLTEETPLADLKLDSLDIVELQMFYEDRTGTMIPDTTKPLVTVGDLLELLP